LERGGKKDMKIITKHYAVPFPNSGGSGVSTRTLSPGTHGVIQVFQVGDSWKCNCLKQISHRTKNQVPVLPAGTMLRIHDSPVRVKIFPFYSYMIQLLRKSLFSMRIFGVSETYTFMHSRHIFKSREYLGALLCGLISRTHPLRVPLYAVERGISGGKYWPPHSEMPDEGNLE
jgi:hypothetical protein